MAADPKPSKPVRDRYVFTQFHDREWDCLGCGHGRDIQAHHIVSRGQGGDDVAKNLVPLCSQCHGAYHGKPYRAFGVRVDAGFVRRSLARYIRSEAGDDTRWYLTGKLGAEAAVEFVERLEAS